MSVGEITWLRRLRRQVARQQRGGNRSALRLGIGDDAALLDVGAGWEAVVTTDLFLEDVHFLQAYDPPAVCGWRAATRALSDLAAMGAQPLALFLSCAFPATLPDRWTRDFYRGVSTLCRQSGATIAGGDVAGSPAGIVIDIVGVGRVERGRALQRSGARPGDRLFASGRLGLGVLGRALAHHSEPLPFPPPLALTDVRQALARHRRPQARLTLGRELIGIASAAIDISDGLSTDLLHLSEESAVGATVDAARIPCPRHPDGVAMALGGGEDYELLFTVPPKRLAQLQRKLHNGKLAGVPISEIGEMTRAPGVWLVRDGKKERLRRQGWQHWSDGRPSA